VQVGASDPEEDDEEDIADEAEGVWLFIFGIICDLWWWNYCLFFLHRLSRNDNSQNASCLNVTHVQASTKIRGLTKHFCRSLPYWMGRFVISYVFASGLFLTRISIFSSPILLKMVLSKKLSCL
jgi:hypothetical protein